MPKNRSQNEGKSPLINPNIRGRSSRSETAPKLKVLTVVGTRPEIIRLACVLKELDAHTEHVLVHTGQNYDYELNEIFFKDLELRKPDHFLGAAGATAAETIGQTLMRIDPLLAKIKPDAFLVLGDTNSCTTVIAAKRRRIPVFHMEAGNRCFDDRVPEEINRRLVDHLADINLPYSDHARQLLLREGLAPDRVIKTGSPMFEVLTRFRPKIDASKAGARLKLKRGEYFVVSAHREENVDDPARLRALCATLNAMAKKYKQRVIVSTHPRTRKRLEALGLKFDKRVELHKPFSFTDYVALQMGARAVLSDSGTITEESSILGFPALNLRDTHERHEGMEEAAVMLTGIESRHVLRALDVLLAQRKEGTGVVRTPADYTMPNVSQKVLRILLSYTDYVNRTVWRQQT
jgi:UDP-N-acetylglucosamine 2-epimerase (non-hydrolysing)